MTLIDSGDDLEMGYIFRLVLSCRKVVSHLHFQPRPVYIPHAGTN